MQPIDIVILSNAVGEVVTWVRPVVKTLRQELGTDSSLVRISVVLSPCPNSTGKEAAIANSYPEVDRVQAAEDFFPFLLWGKTAENWQWRKQGIVVFLGGDQFYSLVIGKRLGYQTLVYAEWDARWYRYLDAFAVMNPEVMAKVPKAYHHKFTVVGDLIADVVLEVKSVPSSLEQLDTKSPIIGLLPGSKPAKLMQGVPLCMAIADAVHKIAPSVQFIIPVAPTLDLSTLVQYANPQFNPLNATFDGVSGQLITSENQSYLLTAQGTKIQLITQFPAYQFLVQCQLCLTTVGANTAELGALGIPAIVLLPTQQLDAMRSWDGIPGILANLPVVGTNFAKLINWLILRQKKLFAWPNIWAKSEIMPEIVGQIVPREIAEITLDFLANPVKLQQIHHLLLQNRGRNGAAKKIVRIIMQRLDEY
ncbi:MAG: lipid-A-disaccharide synthase [Xenococcaceae cyanobacterium MO_234.B1]|nr:lipid-A-disaccharide synthase [Xenococcaceae cyanobacterium MO_234.B1]